MQTNFALKEKYQTLLPKNNIKLELLRYVKAEDAESTDFMLLDKEQFCCDIATD